ncbi:hypothetical protein [Paraferrimonas haliotis]|uniref:Uncharacterized protein n=1 Tax=Paraferrimonas haliotis TaxID=2013866 RepID=A0AA37TS87_9GAMM|nr:hypothetical protein [Paraferrimonas haliotis]GLS84450.1 hypothetical protein GCM10007894_24270 [Paraferrimonas haliotis]
MFELIYDGGLPAKHLSVLSMVYAGDYCLIRNTDEYFYLIYGNEKMFKLAMDEFAKIESTLDTNFDDMCDGNW